MATLTLTTPVRIGNLVDGVTITSLNVASIKFNFQTSEIEVVLVCPRSSNAHTTKLSGIRAVTALNELAVQYPNLQAQVLKYVSEYLPDGTIS